PTNNYHDNPLANLTDIHITNGYIDDSLLLLNYAKQTPTSLPLKAAVFQQKHLNYVASKNLIKATKLTHDIVIDFAIAELYFYESNLLEATYYYKNVLKELDSVNNINVNLRLANIYTNLMESETALKFFNEVDSTEFENEDYFSKGLVHFQLEQYK